jgi:hypothetical protein
MRPTYSRNEDRYWVGPVQGRSWADLKLVNCMESHA